MGISERIIVLCERLDQHWENRRLRRKQKEEDHLQMIEDAQTVARAWLNHSEDLPSTMDLCLQEPLLSHPDEVILRIHDPEQKMKFVGDLSAHRKRHQVRQ